MAELFLDLEQVSFLDSSGVQSLLDCDQLARDEGVAPLIINARGNVRLVLEQTDLLAGGP